MTAAAYTFTCTGCDRKFEAPGMSDFCYGYLLLRSEESEYTALLSIFEDPLFSECEPMVLSHHMVKSLGKSQQADVVFKIYGLICDPTPDGHPLNVDVLPKCSSCNSSKNLSWRPSEPGRSWPLPSVTCEKWNALSQGEKVGLINQLVQEHVGKYRDVSPPPVRLSSRLAAFVRRAFDQIRAHRKIHRS